MKSGVLGLCAVVAALVIPIVSLSGATVSTITVPSASMKKEIPVTVILPAACRENEKKGKDAKRFPVLYLLHGHSGNHLSWVNGTPIKDLAEQYGLIVVCPDGGFSSWYLDSPEDPAWRYETFVSKELVAAMDGHFPTLPQRDSRAIAGFSMGGHGALFLALRHPAVFGTAVSISGGVDLRPFPGNWDIAKRLGALEEYPDRWKEYSVITLAEKAAPGQLALSIECGVEDFFLPVNRNLHTLLLERNVPHDYAERPGGHTGAYCANALPYEVLFISDHLAR